DEPVERLPVQVAGANGRSELAKYRRRGGSTQPDAIEMGPEGHEQLGPVSVGRVAKIVDHSCDIVERSQVTLVTPGQDPQCDREVLRPLLLPQVRVRRAYPAAPRKGEADTT